MLLIVAYFERPGEDAARGRGCYCSSCRIVVCEKNMPPPISYPQGRDGVCWRTRTLESSHPYENSTSESFHVSFKGASRLSIAFDPKVTPQAIRRHNSVLGVHTSCCVATAKPLRCFNSILVLIAHSNRVIVSSRTLPVCWTTVLQQGVGQLFKMAFG